MYIICYICIGRTKDSETLGKRNNYQKFGEKISFKALENRLQQLWPRKGVLSIVDLGHDYYLITFTREEDHQTVLMEGLWIIYDLYLIVREWIPNFCPSNYMVEQLVV